MLKSSTIFFTQIIWKETFTNYHCYISDETIFLIFFLAQVSCGGHFAESCANCPQGNGADWCNGDCKWLSGQCVDGLFNSLVGDGFCNDETNNAGCLFDGGDCCGSCFNKEYCTECQCVTTEYGDIISNALVGNGICNDETNTINCGFDGFDCCLSNVTDHHCSECSCHSKPAHSMLRQDLNKKSKVRALKFLKI